MMADKHRRFTEVSTAKGATAATHPGRYVYLDETTSGGNTPLIGCGMLVVDQAVGSDEIEIAMSELRKALPAGDEFTRKRDEQTLERGYFHASKDSRHAHSVLCSLIQRVDGHFYGSLYDQSKLHEHSLKLADVYEQTTREGLVLGLRSRSPVQVCAEERDGLSIDTLRASHRRFEEEVLESAVKVPQIPAFFPQVKFEVRSKPEPGLQLCDFLLWSACRSFRGRATWLERAVESARFQFRAHSEDYRWRDYDCELGKGCEEPVLYYTHEDQMREPEVSGRNLLIGSFLTADELHAKLCQSGLPAHLTHLRREVDELSRSRRSVLSAHDYVSGLARLYLKLFDTLPVITAQTEAGQRSLLLHSRRQLALVLRSDLVNGIMARNCLVTFHRGRAKEGNLDESG